MTQKMELHQDVQIPIGSETVAATRYEPIGKDDTLPALLMYFPYRKDDHHVFGKYSPIVEYLSKNGYEVVVADMVGTGGSSGWKENYHESIREGKEAAEIINWLAEQDWTNGRVGMFGKSYAGMTCLNAAAQKPDALEAIVPMYALLSLNEDWRMEGGAINPLAMGGLWNSQMQAFEALPPSYQDTDGRWAEVWKDRLKKMRENPPKLVRDIRTNLVSIKQDHTSGSEGEIDPSEVNIPTFAVSGWRDLSPSSTIEIIESIRAPRRAIIGPWRHTMPHRGREVSIDFLPLVLEWFDYFLKDIENDALSRPTYSIYTETGSSSQMDGVWRGIDAIQPINTKRNHHLAFSISPEGLVQSEQYRGQSFEAEYEIDHSVGMESQDGLDFPIVDTNADDVRSFYQDSKPIHNPIEYTGFGEMAVRLQSTNSDPIIGVRLIDVDENGRAKLVSHGKLRPCNVHGYPDVLKSEKVYCFNIPLKPKSHVFQPGHRIRLAISGSYFPVAIPSTKHGIFTVVSSPSNPTEVKFAGEVHSTPISFDNLVVMNQPDKSKVPVKSTYLKDSTWNWETSRNHLTNSAKFRTESEMAVDLPHAEEMLFSQELTAKIGCSTPKRMSVQSSTRMKIVFGTTSATSTVHCRMSEDSVHIRNQVEYDGIKIFDERWSI